MVFLLLQLNLLTENVNKTKNEINQTWLLADLMEATESIHAQSPVVISALVCHNSGQ